MVKLLQASAPAKINLFLRVTGRRPDGYHELDSIFVPVSIADTVAVELRPGRARSVALRCNVAALADAQSNLAARAARAFLDEFAIDAGVFIDLKKVIPAGAGLGGGSSDAGAVLRMLAELCLNDAPERIARLARGLGADVPFFLSPRPARVGGIGERIQPLDRFPALDLVIAVPPVEVPTAAVFRALKREHWSGPAAEEDVAAIASGRIEPRHLVNDLAAVAREKYPEIARLESALKSAGARAAAMSGSGGAVFGLFDDAGAARRAAETVRGALPSATVFAATSIAATPPSAPAGHSNISGSR